MNKSEYIYNADLYCEKCINEIKRGLNYDPKYGNEELYDSDDYPKGPYNPSEADYPVHCRGCGEFLENPLTQDGYDYLKKIVGSKRYNEIYKDFYGL